MGERMASAGRRWVWLGLWLSLGVAGCGPGWEVTAGGTGKGYDVYRPEPYLLVLQGTVSPRGRAATRPTTGPVAQQYTAQIVYLPDYSQRYRVRSRAGGTNIYIKDGWELTSLTDQNTVSGLLNSALSAAAPSGVGGGAALDLLGLIGGPPLSAVGSVYPDATGDPSAPPLIQRGVALFKIIYGSDGRVSGLVRVAPSEDGAPLNVKLSDHAPPPVPVPKRTDD